MTMVANETSDDKWTIQRMLQWTTTHFTSKKIESARLDSELLLSHVLKCRRLDLYLKFDQPLQDVELAEFKKLVIRRSKLEPTAYILGRQEFFSRPFEVGPGVLIPRPETEHLVGEAVVWLKTVPGDSVAILDIGCGSGAIAVSLAVEDLRATVTALDLSPVAIAMTSKNATVHGVSERLLIEEKSFSDWQTTKSFDLVVSNPPYIGLSQKETLMKDVSQYEPEVALYGGALGHEMIESWLPKMNELLRPGGLLLCEIGFDQKNSVKNFAQSLEAFSNIEILSDYSGHPRLLRAQKKGT